MQVNPQVFGQIMQMLKNGQNPQQLAMNMLQNVQGTPMGNNLAQLIQNKDYQGIENIARNVCKQNGVDFDQAFAQFCQSLGLNK